MNNTAEITAYILDHLQSQANEERRQKTQRFFKEPIQCFGLTNPETHALSKKLFAEIKSLPKADLFELCTALWQTGYFEPSIIACNWSYALHKQYAESDFALFKTWVNQYISNWASCDTFCNHSMGTLILKYPHLMVHLKEFCQSPNRWVRRAAAVSLIVPARKGYFLNDILEIASHLLMDTDDMVQKGYGWMLKEASKAHEEAIFEFVMAHKLHMPRTALRYAIEKLPADKRKQAMVK